LNKEEVLQALRNQPIRDWEMSSQIGRVLAQKPFDVSSWSQSGWGPGVEYFVTRDSKPITFHAAAPARWPPEACKLYEIVVSDFDRLVTAKSYECIREGNPIQQRYQLDNPCDPHLVHIAQAIAQQLDLRYVGAFELHEMTLEWEELPKHNEAEFVARLDYSEPNAFSLLFYEWD
jgi:hypothetical protein